MTKLRLTSYAFRWMKEIASNCLGGAAFRSHVGILAFSSCLTASALYASYPRTSHNESAMRNSDEGINLIQDRNSESAEENQSVRKPYTVFTRQGDQYFLI